MNTEVVNEENTIKHEPLSSETEKQDESVKEVVDFTTLSDRDLISELDLSQELDPPNIAVQLELMKIIRSRIDLTDEHYVTQQTLSSEGIIEILILLMDSKDNQVVANACDTLALLSSNVESAKLRSGLEVGFKEKDLNPIQIEIQDHECIKKLVSLLDSSETTVVESAHQTLVTLCSTNRENQLQYLNCLVHDLLEGNEHRIAELNELVPDMVINEDVAVLLDQTILPILKILKEKDDDLKFEAIILVGNICKHRPAAAKFMCEEGILMYFANFIVEEGKKDLSKTALAVNSFWQLIKNNKNFLFPEHHAFGEFDPCLLVEPIKAILKSGPLADLVFFDKGKSTEEASQAADSKMTEELEEVADYSDEALLVLKAISERDSNFRKEARGIDLESSKCTIS